MMDQVCGERRQRVLSTVWYRATGSHWIRNWKDNSLRCHSRHVKMQDGPIRTDTRLWTALAKMNLHELPLPAGPQAWADVFPIGPLRRKQATWPKVQTPVHDCNGYLWCSHLSTIVKSVSMTDHQFVSVHIILSLQITSDHFRSLQSLLSFHDPEMRHLRFHLGAWMLHTAVGQSDDVCLRPEKTHGTASSGTNA